MIVLWQKKLLKAKETGDTRSSGREDFRIEKANLNMCPLSQLSSRKNILVHLSH